MHRFFAPTLDPGDETTTLPRGEAEHLTRVLRMGPGDALAVFDGRGHEFLARVVTADRRSARVQLLSRLESAQEPSVPITLVQAVLKGDKMDDVVRDAVMLGAAAVQPIVAKRSETTVAALGRGGRADRWRRIALASVKQSRRAVLPDVRMPLSLESYLGDPAAALTLMFVEPGAAATEAEPLSILRGEPQPTDVALLVGPEGGWAEQEVRLAHERGARLVSLGPRTLRADAMPVAVLSILQFLWG